ncbi:Uncharacterised protein [Mycobacteroides abscessus subsp. abscessus]|uniref:hypothetical protein n=1 Tax=Mycobacteroides abscessus TaxID=36809 RepID=UPI000929E424|nr:hypothetical protein [Mycobacteroides abscessus]SIH36868.1 Uncharacterised protein [Mycobacteroides abscessus subsp. abscessus]
MPQLQVKVVIDTGKLRWWAAKHQELGHLAVAETLATAATHYDTHAPAPGADDAVPAPSYTQDVSRRELHHWAAWHADRGSVAVAHVLYEAAGVLPLPGNAYD